MVHVPFAEKVDWTLHIGLRYLASLFVHVPASLVAAFRDRLDEAPSDEVFAALMTQSAYSKFLVEVDHGPDEVALRPIIEAHAGRTLRKIDFTAMNRIDPYEGMWVAGTLTLVGKKPDDSWEVLAIAVGDLALEPVAEQRGAFDLAKLFVLQGAAYAMLFTEHPNLHFPFDAINAVTKTILPVDHVVHRALAPHLRFQLPLNNAVLLSPNSVITNFKPTLYAPFTANMRDGLLELFVAGYAGVPHHDGYPTFSFEDTPKLVDSDYGAFGRAYYEKAFLPFATVIAQQVKDAAAIAGNDDADYIQSWAHFLAPMVPGFPTRETILQDDNLAKALARILYTLSVGHALDHQCFSYDVSVEQKYLRLRLAPPASKTQKPVDVSGATSWMDRFRARLAHKIFFEPHVITKLLDVEYGFTQPPMSEAVNAFKRSLRQVEASWQGRLFMKLDETPASIQY